MRTRNRATQIARLLALSVALAACGRPSQRWHLPAAFRELAAPLVIAHRGGMALWPENTLPAFRGALALGADVLELDVRRTADGELVVIHDATVDRTTDGTGAVAASTLAHLQQLDAGFRWSPDGGRTFPHRGRGITIPTLRELLDALPAARLSIEVKPPAGPSVVELCRLLAAAGAAERVMVGSFDSAGLERFRDACPAVATGATPFEVGRFVTASALRVVPLPRLRAAALQLPERYRGVPVLTAHVVAEAHAHGLPVHAWVIDDARDMRRLLAMGVDGIVTDRPDVLLDVLNRRARPAVGSP